MSEWANDARLDALRERLRRERTGEAEVIDIAGQLEAMRSKITLLPDPTPEQLAERERTQWLAEAARLGVPARLAEASLDSQPTKALTLVRGYLQEDYAAGRCLALLGPTGVGKSWAAVAALRASRDGKRFFYFPQLASMLLDRDRFKQAMEYATRWRFVVFDDIGTEYLKEGGMLVAVLDEIFYMREGNALPTIITSNLTAEQFRERMSDRIVDRMRGEWGRVVNVAGESLRRKPR